MSKCCRWVIIILILVAVALAAGLLYLNKKIDGIDKKIDPTTGIEEIAPELKGLSVDKLIDVEAGSCGVSGFDIPGEGQGAGGTGGFALVGEGQGAGGGFTTVAIGDVTSPANVISTLDPHSLAELTNLNESVAILVVDIFDGEFNEATREIQNSKYTLDDEIFTLDLASLSPDPATREQALRDRVDDVSHGALVLNHTIALIQATGKYEMDDSELVTKGRVRFTEKSTEQAQRQADPVDPEQDIDPANPQQQDTVDPQQGPTVEEYQQQQVSNPKEILVWSLDIGNLSTTAELKNLSRAINNTFNELDSYSNQGINEIVLNMSFSLVPCNTLEDFLANKDRFPTLESYIEAVAVENRHIRGDFPGLSDIQWQTELTKLILTAPSQDVLYLFDFIGSKARRKGENVNIIYAAAAGNYSLPYSLYPAAWPEVISVSANDIEDNSQVGFSNKGKISAHGDWYFLPNPVGENLDPNPARNNLDNQKIAYAGTSFAAPVVSVFTALDLARGDNNYKCAREHQKFHYNFYKLPKLLQARGTSNVGIYDTNSGNVPLETAVGEACN